MFAGTVVAENRSVALSTLRDLVDAAVVTPGRHGDGPIQRLCQYQAASRIFRFGAGFVLNSRLSKCQGNSQVFTGCRRRGAGSGASLQSRVVMDCAASEGLLHGPCAKRCGLGVVHRT